MNILKRVYIHIIGLNKIIRSLLFCLKYLPFSEAIKIPVFLEVPIDVVKLKKGNIVLRGAISTRQILFVEGINLFSSPLTRLYVEEDSRIVFEGRAFISKGCSLRVDSGGILEIGNGFIANKNCIIRCSDRVLLHDDVMMGWNNEINDNDGHPIYIDDIKIKSTSPISIGPHVWITSYVKVSKGVHIPSGCIVAKGAVVTKKHENPNSLIGGVPAKDIKSGINWSIN